MTPDGRPDRDGGGEAVAALIADVEETTRLAAIDGLPLSHVFDDLRLVLDLEPGDDLPADVLRAAALAWERTQRGLAGGGPYDGVACATPDHVEGTLWSLLAADGEAPAFALVVRTAHATGLPDGLALREVDLLVTAARTLLTSLDGPGDYLGLVRDPGTSTPDRLLALSGDAERIRAARAQLVGLAPPGGTTLVVTEHELRGRPEGSLAALRAAIAHAR